MTDNLPATMNAVEISEPGGPEVLRETTRPTPTPAFGEILIQIVASGVNRPDCLQRAGAYPPPAGASDLPGLEAAGFVAAVGEGVSRWRVGDEVCALLPGGGYAEYATCPAEHALPIPDGLTMIEAAALPETFFTVYSNLFMRIDLKAGETLLVHGGSSGIGSVAIMLGKAFGVRVFVTAGNAEKCAYCEGLGAERAINYRDEDFVSVIKELTDGKGVDTILDMVGGSYLPRNINALAMDGRLCSIAQLGGATSEVNIAKIMMKRLIITGSTLRPQSVEAKAVIAHALEQHVWPLIASGRLKPRIDAVFGLDRAESAHTRMEGSEHMGKIVLTV